MLAILCNWFPGESSSDYIFARKVYCIHCNHIRFRVKLCLYNIWRLYACEMLTMKLLVPFDTKFSVCLSVLISYVEMTKLCQLKNHLLKSNGFFQMAKINFHVKLGRESIYSFTFSEMHWPVQFYICPVVVVVAAAGIARFAC